MVTEIAIGQIIQDFSVIMIIASAMAFISYKLKQPLVIGYIIAGIIIGPHTPPFSLILNQDILNLFAEMGVILLLFVVGMEFPIEKLRRIGKKALIIASSEAFGTFSIGFSVSFFILHFSLFDSAFAALAISVTSTVIIMKVLEELDIIKEEASYIILGVAIMEDIIIISMLAVLQSVSTSGNLSIVDILISISITMAFIFGVLLLGSKIIPKLINFIGKFHQHEVLLLVVLGLAFGLSFLSYQIGISVATGAFFAGVLIAESKVHAVTRILATPIRDMFGAIFFVSVGALMDMSLLLIFIIPASILVVVSIAAKFLTVFLSSKSQGFSSITSMKAAFGLSSSGGELALVVAKGGVDTGLTSAFLLPMIGAMTIITTFISPYMIKLGWRVPDKVFSKNDEQDKGKDKLDK
ncbi:MAG: cation:proton antiporter [Nitrososphaeraceae archaeon]|jgi:monovalent cation:H+ antiporter-2, CPA2 family|nr:cation:proton antiporter [Nitrososphaeraceae archaeon]